MILAEVRGFLARVAARLRRYPQAYTLGPLLMVAAVFLLAVSLRSDLRVVDGTAISVDAPPGTADSLVPFNVTPLFRASFVFGPCGVELYLLSDAEYADYVGLGRLPSPTLDCNRTDALLQFAVRHLVTYNSGAANASLGVSAAFLGFVAPYALLSIPGTVLALVATVWISITMLGRGMDEIREDLRRIQREKKGKEK